MISIFTAVLLLCFYGLCQYLIARWGESHSAVAEKVKSSATTYSLSLAVFCTSWTYYGNIGQASSQGIHHISLYLGSTITFVFFTPILKKMVRIKLAYHSTSIADFISTRYNNSQLLAAIITILCLVGITPYISIQLKSIITTFHFLVRTSADKQSHFFSQLDIIVVLLMIMFTIVFGVRRLDPTERHPGMMVALASESLLKIIAFLGAGLLICFVLFNGFDDIINIVSQKGILDERFDVFSQPSEISSWLTSMVLGAIGIIALPRQFHVGIVECSDEKVLDRARWMFPLYLFVINLMVIPIAMVGVILLPIDSQADLMLLEIPVLHGNTGVAAMVFIGGFAASTGMIMVSAMTLSTMATNHIVLPVIEYIPRIQFLRRYLLYTRWVVVGLILFLSLFYYRVIGDSELIVKIGLISFVAIAQLMPSLIGGLLWKKGNLYGALTGLIGGTIIWFYTSMLPSVIRSGWLETNLLSEGLFSQSWLKPEELLGLQISSAIGHSLFWSLFVNICLYILVSEWHKITDKEVISHTHKFMTVGEGGVNTKLSSKNVIPNIILEKKLKLLVQLLIRYIPQDKAFDKIALCCQQCHLSKEQSIDVIQLSQLKTQVTNVLAGIIGMAAANRAVQTIELFNRDEQELLSASYSEILAKSQMSPDELIAKVDFYQEKQNLLQNHADLQENTILQLKSEKKQTYEAKKELKELNEDLEQRVTQRTQELTTANNELISALDELKRTELKLVEADKMASLGGLVAGVAHEINTPVGVVLTAITSLQAKYLQFKQLYDEQKISKNDMQHFLENVDEIGNISLRNIKRAVALVESFKQVAVDQTSEERRLFNMSEYIQHILLSLKSKIKKTSITVTVDCQKDLVINSYPGAISQILSNFIINSILHAFEEGQSGNIVISAHRIEGNLHLDYSDDGKGLSKDERANIFEPFYTTKRGAGGSGLGAHIAYNLVTQLLQGDISIDTGEKNGLMIQMKFPVS